MKYDLKKREKAGHYIGTGIHFLFGVIKPYETIPKKTSQEMFSTLIKWKLNRLLAPVLWTTLLIHSSFAQVQQPQRFEVSLGDSEPSFEVTSSEYGLFLHRHLLTPTNGQIELIRIDTALTVSWQGMIPVDENLVPVGKKAEGENAFFLLRYNNSKNFELFKVNQRNGNYHQYSIKSFIRFNPVEFQVTNDAVLIGGYFNRVPLVLYFSFSTLQSKVLPGIFNEEGELTQIKTYEDGTFQLLISAYNADKQRTLWIKNYMVDGSLIENYALKPDDNKSLIFGRSIKTINNMQIVAGVYGNRFGEYSRGLFVATIDPNGIQQLRYYNYADLKNFFNYMKAKRTNRIMERIERRKIKGKKIKFNYRFLVHEVLPHNNQYLLLGEAFYPQYKSISRSSYGGFFTPYNFASSSMIRGDQIFDGYRYTHAVVIGFDHDGNLLWDNSFEINDIKTYTLEQYVKLETKQDKIILLYLFENEIRTKIIQGDKVLEGKSSDPIRTLYENDIVAKEGKETRRLDYWYDDYFYAYGVQNILNLSQVQAPKRRVFFINKVGYEIP